eukprot:scaffold42603_cov18-Tisochrysis_lutea.AAC.1
MSMMNLSGSHGGVCRPQALNCAPLRPDRRLKQASTVACTNLNFPDRVGQIVSRLLSSSFPSLSQLCKCCSSVLPLCHCVHLHAMGGGLIVLLSQNIVAMISPMRFRPLHDYLIRCGSGAPCMFSTLASCQHASQYLSLGVEVLWSVEVTMSSSSLTL